MDMVSLTFIHLRLPLISIRSGFCIYVFKLLYHSSYTEHCIISGYCRENYWFPSFRVSAGKINSWGILYVCMCVFQEPLPDKEEGLSFYFRINGITHFTKLKCSSVKYFMLSGIPVFAKGSNWIPADAFESRLDNKTLQWLLQSAVASHQNMIRVWYVEWNVVCGIESESIQLFSSIKGRWHLPNR